MLLAFLIMHCYLYILSSIYVILFTSALYDVLVNYVLKSFNPNFLFLLKNDWEGQ